MKPCRRHASKPHYKQSAEWDYSLLIIVTFCVGALCGATVALGVVL